MSLWLLPFAASLLLIGCAPATPTPGSCAGAGPGPSGEPLSDQLTLCVLDEAGQPVRGASISVDGEVVGASEADGRLDLFVAPDSVVEVRRSGMVTHTLLGISTSRFGVTLPDAGAATRGVTGTLSGFSTLPPPNAGATRSVEVRGGSRLTPLSLAAGLSGIPATDCPVTGDTCAFSLELDARVEHIDVTIVDTTAGQRTVRHFAVSPAISGGDASFALPPAAGVAATTLTGPIAEVVGVPGSRVGDEVLFFGPGSSATDVATPDETVGGTPWIALVFDAGVDQVRAGIVQDAGARAEAPSDPRIAYSGGTLTLPAGVAATISLGGAGGELRRVTVLDGRTAVPIESSGATRLAVILRDSADPLTAGSLSPIRGVVGLPLSE